MTVQRVDYLQNLGNVYTAEETRRFLRLLAYRVPGVSGVGDYAVVQNGTPNMSVNVAAGEALVLGTETTTQGIYYAYNDATLNRTIATADATNPRNDLVVLRVRDQVYSGTSNDGDVVVVTGTPAPTPADPTPPVNSLTLARVRVNAGAGSITNATITDLRVWQAGKIVAGAGGWALRNSADSADNLNVSDAGIATLRNALSIPPSAGGSLPPTSYGSVPLKYDEQTGSGASSITIPASGSIPSTFRAIRIHWKARTTSANVIDTLVLRMNGDTGSNYKVEASKVEGGTGSSAETTGTSANIAWVTGGGSAASYCACGYLEIPFYADTSFQKLFFGQNAETDNTFLRLATVGGVWASTAAVASVTLLLSAGNFTNSVFWTELLP